MITRKLVVVASVTALVASVFAMGGASTAHGSSSGAIVPLALTVPRTAAVFPAHADAYTYCTLPDRSSVDYFHCYTPQQIRSFYGVDQVASINGHSNYGKGQTIVLVDAYGSPTAASDLQTFHDKFFPDLPIPNFIQEFPQGNPQYNNTANGQGLAGSNGAAGWSGEATLDIEWAYAIAPEAHIVLLAVPPAETEGVQGYPNLFKAISGEIDATPPGTVFSMSFASTEQAFGGAAASQVAKFDQVFQKGIVKGDNFFGATGDTGTVNSSKLQKDGVNYSYPTVNWPASSPYVVAVGGTQVQSGWTWDPTSNTAFTSSGFNDAYWQSTNSGNSQAVWNESWGPIGSGGGVSTIYPEPTWQNQVGSFTGRTIPDVSWNSAVNGGVDVYISAYPQYNCGQSTGCWTIYGGTSAATPQTAATIALVNAARASENKAPIGFLDPILYSGIGASAYNDVVPRSYGTATAGELNSNQMWDSTVLGNPTKVGYDLTTGWGTPQVNTLISTLFERP